MCNVRLPSRTEIENCANMFRTEHADSEAELHYLFSLPENRDVVEQRVRRLNAIYHARVSMEDQSVLVKRICELKIEEKARNPEVNVELVCRLARYGRGLRNNHLSFVSKYFSFCNPDVYPLFDGNVMAYLKKINDEYHFIGDFRNNEYGSISASANYDRFIEIWSAFRNLSDDLKSVNVNDLDKYMWIKGST